MKNVRQKINSCRRAAVLLALAILLPFGKTLAETATVDIGDATLKIIFSTTGAPQGNLPANYIPATITSLSVTIKSGHTLTTLTIPKEVPQADPSKYWTFTKYDIKYGMFATVTEVIVPENVVEIASLPSFPNANAITLPSTLKTMSAPSNVLGKIGLYGTTSLTIREGNEYFSQENGLLYNNDQTRLLFVHEKLTSATFKIKESVTGIGADNSSTWENVFQSKTGITTLEIPATCILGSKTKYESFYNNWPGLLNVNIYGENTDHSTYKYYSVDGVVFKYGDDGNILVNYPQARTDASYKVPNGVKEILAYGFYKSKFTSIDLNQVEKLTTISFFRCENKLDLTIGESLANIPPNSFAETKIKSYNVVDENQHFASDAAGVLFNKGMTKLLEYPQGADDRNDTYIVPATVTEIGEKAFSDCKNFKGSITFAGTGLTTIGKNAFDKCDLTSIDLSGQSGITEIPESCFSQSELNTILPPPNLTTIGKNAFFGTKLKGTLKLPNGVTSIGEYAFGSCKDLTGVFFPENLSEIGANAFNGCKNLSEENTTLPTTVTTLGEAAFNDCGFTAVTIPTVENYGGGAFRNNKKLESATIPEGMTIIPNREFQGCEMLKSISIPSTITEISRGAFSGTALTSVTIPASVTKIGYNYCGDHGATGAFENCTQLTEIIFEDRSGAEQLEILDNTFKGCTSLTNVSIPAGGRYIGCYAFYGCTALESVSLTDVTVIWHRAFAGCTSLKTLDLPETLATIKASAFARCTSLTTVNLPANLKILEDDVFLNCRSLKTVNVPDGSRLTSIPKYAFCWTTDDSIEEYDSNNEDHILTENEQFEHFNFRGSSDVESIWSSAFYSCVALKSFECPSSLTNIYSSAFYGCKNLETLTFKANGKLKNIYQLAFKDCVKLTNITFPETLRSIGFQSFYNCSSLTEVNFPAMIQTIDGEAFEFCPNIEEFNVAEMPEDASDKDWENRQYSSVGGYLMLADKTTLVGFPEAKANDRFTLLPPSITAIGPYAFFNCQSLKNVVIPNKVTSIGERSFGLCTNLKTITFLCDEVINPAEINQLKNQNSFEEKVNDPFEDEVKDDGFAGMTFYVRADLVDDYKKYKYYWPDDDTKKPTIIPSFKADVRKFNPSWESDKAGVEQNEYINVSEKVVDFLSTTSTDHTFVLPEKVGDYDVGLIGDYAFENASDEIKEVVVFNNISYIGGNAFVTKLADEKQGRPENESSIKRIFFVTNAPENGTPVENATALEKLEKEQLSTTRFKLTAEYTTGDKDYSEFTSGQQIFVKKSMCEGYKASWPRYADRIDYRIMPQSAAESTPATRAGSSGTTDSDFINIAAGKKYATFSREFDVDLGQYTKDTGNSDFDIKAFATGKVANGPGNRHDYPEDDDNYNAPYHLRMHHIGEDGTYVPNNTGVLLAVMKDWGGTPSDYYYCIHEGDKGGTRNSDSDDNATLRMSVKNGVILSSIESGENPTQWVMQGGVFKPVKSKDISVPVHKAWLYLDMSEFVSAGAPMTTFGFSLDNFSDETGVETPELGAATDANGIYTLTGVKVLKPEGKGIYIVNGKKMVIR